MLKACIDQLGRSVPLAPTQVSQAVAQLVDQEIATALKAEFLTALARKGETLEEIAGFARELRARAVQPPLDPATRARLILDVCGTGGDRLGTFNISTTVALILASADITVAKHGNRAVTSQAGSADVLEALGVATDLSPERAAQWMRDLHFAFFFAPKYHPAFKQIAPARALCAERGQRTIFNFLGPLLNPARPSAQLLGVPRPELCETIARVLQSLGVRRAMVVSGKVPAALCDPPAQADPFLDELSTLSETTIAEFCQPHALSVSTLSPHPFPLQPARLADLAGADPQGNAEIVRRILAGTDRGPRRDAVLLNATAALVVAGEAKTLIDGWDLAAELVDSGRSRAKLEQLIAASRALAAA